ncbi:C-terminal processing peptidase-1. Serine peptidase. MEROPS family S41A [Modicisalibacter ilicicola DSM 19980]|uniref:C-terminal processing peptidase-1. Serine peptidase. MEROPS family S41A n=1 Tax=Modicisalibacter ilicicola DSM 19980 TaxID=1121942 RepID=A0A1M5CI51_9GAMM|nr:carboxy terminal-processing peptidase [Halomonas ilicicola]SHF54360.1 C-terminal processing peptidase-1. Serine peptidase. MEROPS family S41A [Halomonas ilicicola DSM 19980]
MSLIAATRCCALVASLLVALSTSAFAGPSPTDAQRQAATEVAESLRYGHYADITLDDAWSRRAFEQLLDVMDSQRAYLLKDDIEDFSDLRTTLDDALYEGELERVYEFYSHYQDRLESRLEWLIDQIDAGLAFDYTGNERLMLEREEMAWERSQKALDAVWERRLKNAALSLELSDQTPEAIQETLRERYAGQLSRVRQTNAEDVFGLFMAAVTSTVDPHTEYLSPRQGESFDIQMKLSLEGIGALLQSEGEYVKVSSLVAGGPADKSGVLQPADRIVAVGQGEEGEMTNVVGMRLDEVVDLIRGPKGSTVRLDIIPAKAVDVTRSRTVKIVRDTVELEDQAASSEIVTLERDGGEHRIGIIEIPTFYVDFDAWQAGEEDYRSTTRDVAKEIERLKGEGVEGIVLDLRNDGGGALQEANSLIGLFIDRGPTVQVRDAEGRISLYGDTDSGSLYEGPLAVLVNRLSASASEIVAGAIQDYGRGLVLGNRTFGKGTVQTLNELNHGQIKLTRAKFYRISGESTQHRGVYPDLEFPNLVDPELIGESTLENALPWDTVRSVQYRRYGNPDRYLDTLRGKHEERVSEDANFTYLKRQASLTKQLREQQTTISLNREQRKREMEAQEREQLALENRRRRALGLEPLDDWIDAREEEPGDSEEEAPVDRAQIIEGAQILLDYALLTRND